MDRNQKNLIFDFDGTLADSGLKIYEIINEILPSFGIKKIETEDLERLRHQNTEKLLKEFNVPIYMIPIVFYKFEEKYLEAINEIKPIKGIPEVIKKLSEKDVRLHIASSNSVNAIKLFLEKNDLNYFKIIKGSSGFLGKTRILKKIAEEEGIPVEDIVYIGDEIRDISSARKAGMKSAAVTWGFNTKTALIEYEPDILVTNPEDLLKMM